MIYDVVLLLRFLAAAAETVAVASVQVIREFCHLIGMLDMAVDH